MPSLILFFLLSLLLAANGFIVEYNLSQCLSAVLGGTIIRYQTSVGIFTFSLGLGSLLYLPLSKKFIGRTLLIFCNLCVGLLAWLGPLFVQWLDPLGYQSLILLWLCYLPIVLLGVVTGLELPSLFSIAGDINKDFNPDQSLLLYADYLGMFLVSLAFPWLLIKGGISLVSNLSLLLMACIFLILFFIPKNQLDSDRSRASQWPNVTMTFLLFLTSFLSISYELSLAKLFSELFYNEVLAHSFTIGFYLLGLAAGVFSLRKGIHDAKDQLIKNELLLSVFALLVYAGIFAMVILWKLVGKSYLLDSDMIGLLQVFTILIGFFSGRELPLLLSWIHQDQKVSQAIPLSINYFGALFAGFLVPLVFFPVLGAALSLIFLATVNLLVAIVLGLVFGYFRSSLRWLVLPPLLVVALLSVRSQKFLEQTYLKTLYHNIIIPNLSVESLRTFFRAETHLRNVIRLRSLYQNIDLVRNQLPYEGGGEGELTLYLNQQPQFSTDNWTLYHDSFALAASQILGRLPQNVLILGGGDGLLAGRLRHHGYKGPIDLVELDEQMVRLSSEHHQISQMNGGIFSDRGVRVIYEDAYSWLKKNHYQYEAVFIDFPYPSSFELSRLYSREFYQLVLNHLASGGAVTLDAPIRFSVDSDSGPYLKSYQALMATLHFSGFSTVFPMGPVEPFIVAFKEKREVQFDYKELEAVENHSFVNFLGISSRFPDYQPSQKDVNSIFHPQYLELR
ncbi:MAG: hypothetical protein KDD33_02820 [Bdellovibrionales bacterium]|nr:hypothetical protein [Bdellovibrionales bacterium]